MASDSGGGAWGGSGASQRRATVVAFLFAISVITPAGGTHGTTSAAAMAIGSRTSCPALPALKSVTVKEIFWSIAHSQQVVGMLDNGVQQSLGYVTSRLFSWQNEQEWKGAGGGTLIAASHRDVVSLLSTVHVLDCRLLPLVDAVEELQTSLTSSVLFYTLRDTRGNVIARSSEGSELGKDYVQVSDAASGKALVRVYKGATHWTDAWEARFEAGAADSGAAGDPRTVVMMLAASSQSLAFGLGALPFILFLLVSLAAGITCCFANRQRVLEWAAGVGQPAYEEIKHPAFP